MYIYVYIYIHTHAYMCMCVRACHLMVERLPPPVQHPGELIPTISGGGLTPNPISKSYKLTTPRLIVVGAGVCVGASAARVRRHSDPSSPSYLHARRRDDRWQGS